MSDETPIDQIKDLPHPREVYDFYGNRDAEADLAHALNSGKMPHGLIISGPKGIGKATLAYRLARRYLGAKPIDISPLASDEDDIVCQQIAAGSYPDLRTATRFCYDKQDIRANITVATIRHLIGMFELKSANPLGRRVAIIDSADDLRTEGANALLKTLEEPPKGALIILLANSLGAVLQTLRSRCRILRLEPMNEAEIRDNLSGIGASAAALSYGRIGRAKALAGYNVERLYGQLSEHLAGFPNTPLKPALALANAAKDNETFEIIIDLIKDWLLRTTKSGIGVEIIEVEPGESATLARLARPKNQRLTADTLSKIETLRAAAANNLDKASIVLEALNLVKSALR